ncbi:hypothetical protein G6F68_017147 [Rhizopus microsporus]|nr:hypothetical protein G6F68_017147 [Rhizopus microsporus]
MSNEPNFTGSRYLMDPEGRITIVLLSQCITQRTMRCMCCCRDHADQPSTREKAGKDKACAWSKKEPPQSAAFLMRPGTESQERGDRHAEEGDGQDIIG